jgi:acyl dehydratase/NAD(P)-dependent dehydrogenase (short-subunit alcohol dehydrogenase family)
VFVLIGGVLASRTFGQQDQERFAQLTGDFNPVHMDPVAARRTQPGAQVVHGLHALLWALERIADRYPDIPSLAKLKVRFLKVLYLGEVADLSVVERDDQGLAAEVRAGGNVALRLSASFSPVEEMPSAALDLAGAATRFAAGPLDLTIEQIASMKGRVAFAEPIEEIARAFPAAHRMMGGRRVASLGASSRLIGMICPGLHSLYSGFSFAVCEDKDPAPELAFAVTHAHPHLRVLRQTVIGGGLSGTVESFLRRPPVIQASMRSLAGLVSRDEFADSIALVIGGSRGLGEATAKLLAAAGSRVIISYFSGQSDATRVACEIAGGGGRAETIRYDARLAPEPQLADLAAQPTHLYYFATPPIARRKSGAFDRGRLDEFLTYYVEGFYQLCRCLTAAGTRLSAYYPSSVYVEKCPNGLVEYVMAKAAGELLCANIGALRNLRVTVTRLPPLATDQTAGLLNAETADPATVMLPIIRRVQTA